MMQARVHQIEYSSFARSEIKKIMMNCLPNAAELFEDAMVQVYRQLGTHEAAIRRNPEIPEECGKLLKEW